MMKIDLVITCYWFIASIIIFETVEAREEEITYADTTFYKRNAPKPVRSCHI